jgi:hypothetical protein
MAWVCALHGSASERGGGGGAIVLAALLKRPVPRLSRPSAQPGGPDNASALDGSFDLARDGFVRLAVVHLHMVREGECGQVRSGNLIVEGS